MEYISEPGTSDEQQTPALSLQPGVRSPAAQLVNRELERAQLFSFLQETERLFTAPFADNIIALASRATRRRVCALLVGEAGIGKTRLAEAISVEMLQRHWNVVRASCTVPENQTPYQLWNEVLRDVLDQRLWSPLRSRYELTRYRPLGRIRQEFTEALPGKQGPRRAGSLQLQEAMLALLEECAQAAPLLVFCDNLHLADRQSIALFSSLVPRLPGSAVFFLGCYRDGDLAPDHPLREILNTLRQERLLATVRLAPLTAPEIAMLIEDFRLPSRLIGRIQHAVAGNPFLAKELGRTLAAAPPADDRPTSPFSARPRLPVPTAIASAFEHTLQPLAPDCLRLLRRMAVYGDDCSLAVLPALEAERGTSPDEARVLNLLDQALRAGVLVEERHNHGSTAITYRFRYPLLADYLYEGISATRRARLHGEVARVLQDDAEGREDAAAITYHLIQSGVGRWAEVGPYAISAADRAFAHASYATAEARYRYALALLEREPAPAHDSHLLATLHQRIIDSIRRRGGDTP